ncbi:hypothetical protein RYZ26_01170 [Terasakiella sp. A23]|uniref:hypothetical protein n=1 Tax=Terasakiella sp. FCG-A23 TaxID=3080561 RepID=UPI0029543612|nr:hypothetical protein [Terasakiella sp. A23]MDV7338186.1 hypothetical protein [Terasakiella sp. A23]
MQTFKLTPKPQSDYRLELKELKLRSKLEKDGFRHDKVVYGFTQKLNGVDALAEAGMNIEEIPFVEAQQELTQALVQRTRAKSKLDHLQHDREFNGRDTAGEEEKVQQKITDLNNQIQESKTALGIEGTVKHLKF